MKKNVLIFAVLLIAQSSHAAISPVEGQETHGGNIVVSEFWWQHNDINRVLSQCLVAGQDPLASKWLINNKPTAIKSAPQVFVGVNQDQEVIASNRPLTSPPIILISESLWPKLNAIEKTKITMHEILPILGFIDASYQNSEQLYNTYYNCLVPSRSQRGLKQSLNYCETEYISRWGAAEISAIGKYAMSSAAYFQCLPGILKLLSFGFELKTCNPEGSIDNTPESPLEAFISGYRIYYANSVPTLDFLLKTSTEYLRSDCDPDFKKACKALKYNIDFKGTAKSELATKLSCH